MAKRRSLTWPLAGLAVLAACSSNATPTAMQSSGILHFVSGSHYTYATAVYGDAMPARGTPEPLPTQTSSDSTALTTPASFEGEHDLLDAEFLRKIATKRGTEILRTNDYFAVRSSAGSTLIERVGSSGPDSTLTYTSPAVILEEPLRRGNRWDASASYRLQSKTRDETWNRDGSYESSYEVSVRIGSAPPTVDRVRAVVKSDGSAALVSRVGNCVPVTLHIGVPVRANGKYFIPYELHEARTCRGRAIVTHKLGVDWYPGGGQPPSPLETSSVTDEGSAAIPASCDVHPAVATTGEKIVRIDTTLDPFGTISQSTDTRYYAQPRGLVCNIASATVRVYGTLAGSGLLQTVKTTDVRSMQSFSLGAGAALPSDGATGAVFGISTDRAARRAKRNMTGAGSNTPVLFRW